MSDQCISNDHKSLREIWSADLDLMTYINRQFKIGIAILRSIISDTSSRVFYNCHPFSYELTVYICVFSFAIGQHSLEAKMTRHRGQYLFL